MRAHHNSISKRDHQGRGVKPFFTTSPSRAVLPKKGNYNQFFDADKSGDTSLVMAGNGKVGNTKNNPDIPFDHVSGIIPKRFENDTTLELVRKNRHTLKDGSAGNAVKKIQRALIDAGFALEKFGLDGVYGDETTKAVKEFQESKGLPKEEQDGKIGPVTMRLLDAHFANPAKQGHLSKKGSPNRLFFGLQPMNPRYSNPDAFISLEGDAVRLNGPSFAFLACATPLNPTSDLNKRWELGHIQDIVQTEIVGTYSDAHFRRFVSPLPIRDSVLGNKLFPWYNSDFVRPIKNIGPTCTPHLDDPGVQFLRIDKGVELTKIRMKFKAVDWLVGRDKNTGMIEFIHHARWGFDWNLVLDTANLEDDKTDPITPFSNLPEPSGSNDTIAHGPGMGQLRPSMTEGVFNEQAKLI